jgi:adenylylsulfate kinase
MRPDPAVTYGMTKPDQNLPDVSGMSILSRSGGLIWLTGLSGAGKTTLSRLIQKALALQGVRCELLDGDIVRARSAKVLGFSRHDRDENVRRMGEAALELAQSGAWVVVAAISPYRRARTQVRELMASRGVPFLEVYVRCPLEVAEQRDPKGLYKLARAGQISQFTGVSDPYEEPSQPDLIVDTAHQSPEACAAAILSL